jgi:hypothetical protein
MTVQVAQAAALLSPDGVRRLVAPIAMALLLLPFGAGLRHLSAVRGQAKSRRDWHRATRVGLNVESVT